MTADPTPLPHTLWRQAQDEGGDVETRRARYLQLMRQWVPVSAMCSPMRALLLLR